MLWKRGWTDDRVRLGVKQRLLHMERPLHLWTQQLWSPAQDLYKISPVSIPAWRVEGHLSRYPYLSTVDIEAARRGESVFFRDIWSLVNQLCSGDCLTPICTWAAQIEPSVLLIKKRKMRGKRHKVGRGWRYLEVNWGGWTWSNHIVCMCDILKE